MSILDVKFAWRFNPGQYPIWTWQPKKAGEPSVFAVKGAWRSGKTTAVFRRFTNNQFVHPNMRSLVVRRTYPELKDTSFPFIWNDLENPDNWHGRGLVSKVSQNDLILWTKNGGRIDFRSAIHHGREDPAKFGSISYGQIWIEEANEVSQTTFRTLLGRLSQKGMPLEMMLSFNPPDTRHWLFEEFGYAPNPQRALFTLTMEDNREHLPHGYIESFDHMPPSWRKRYIMGEWGILAEGTPVHPYYTEKAHVAKEPLKFDPRRPVLRGVDGSPTAVYFACVWAQLQYDGRLFVFRGKLWRNEGVKRFKRDIARISGTHYPGAKFVDFGDPAMLIESQIELRTMVDALRPELDVQPGAVAFVDRREAVDEWLLSQVPVDGHLIQALQIDPGPETEMLRDGLAGGYCLAKLDEKYDKKPRPDKSEHSHQVEAFQYLTTGVELVRWRGQLDKYKSDRRQLQSVDSGWMGV